MSLLSERIHSANPPDSYRRVVFDSSIDIVMGLIAFITVITYLLIDAYNPTNGFLARLFAGAPPAPVIFFALIIAWDLTYRIGIGWWTSITSLWRTVMVRTGQSRHYDYHYADLYTIAFAALQLLLLPFLWPDRFLSYLLIGHVAAVLIVSSLAIGLQLHR
jgi:hypothetical protein